MAEAKKNTTNQRDVCGVCNKISELKCSACQKIFYCSREHQKCHWKQHRKDCTPFKMSVDSILGRHYIATRKIDAGEIILEEIKPLISAPLQNTCPLCLNCYSILTNNNSRPCEKCGWPLCNKCNVHDSECEFTIKYRKAKIIINNFGVPHPTYKCIGVIRALALNENDSVSYKKFMNLESHCEYNDDDKKRDLTEKEIEYVEIAQFVRRFFNLDDIKLNEIVKILGIFQINGHEVPTTENPHMAVYDIVSYFEHNCRANCSKSFTEAGGIIIRAATTILKGQHMTLCYTDPLWGVINRQHHLSQTKFFNCTCDRCNDPTEFGTMFNALKCTKCDCDGFLLPSTFITATISCCNGSEQYPDYICTKCNDTTVTWKNAEVILERIGIELTTMLKDDVNACREFIQRNSKIIHDNHYYMTDVKLALVQLIGQQIGGLPNVTDDILNEKISICKKLNHLLRTIVPAENRIRGLVLFEMHAGLAEYGRRKDRNELHEMLMLSRDALIEAYQLLRYEPEILPEGKIAQIAQQNINKMNKIISTLREN